MDKTSERKGTTPQEMAEWIVSEWRSVRGSDRMLVIAITEALKVIPATVGDLEAEIAVLRDALGWMLQDPDSETVARAGQVWDMAMQKRDAKVGRCRTDIVAIVWECPCGHRIETPPGDYDVGLRALNTVHADCGQVHKLVGHILRKQDDA